MNKRRSVDPARVRNVALLGHRSVGKTSLADLMCRDAGVTRTLGSVDAGTSLLDHTDEERRHKQSLTLGFAWLSCENSTIQLVDTPGAHTLAHEQQMGLAAVELALVVVDPSGVKNGTEQALQFAEEQGLPSLVAVSKCDRAGDLDELVASLDALGAARALWLALPWWEDGALVGVVRVLEGDALRFASDGTGKFSAEPIPQAMGGARSLALERLSEAVALTRDDLLEIYLEELELPIETLMQQVPLAVAAGQILPIVPTCCAKGWGGELLLDAITWLGPSPIRANPRPARLYDGTPVEVRFDGVEGENEFVAQVVARPLHTDGSRYSMLRVWSGRPPRGAWSHGVTGASAKIRKLYRIRGPRRASAGEVGPGDMVATWELPEARPGETYTGGERIEMEVPHLRPPMMAWRFAPVEPAQLGKLKAALLELVRSDRGLALHADADTGAVLLAGSNEGHLQLAAERLREQVGVAFATELPPIAYREIPAGAVSKVEGEYVKQGDHGLVSEYGKCAVSINPVSEGCDVVFVDTLPADDEDLPSRYRGAIDEGSKAAMLHGPTAGYPVVGVEVQLVGGAYDILQSTDDHFRNAGEIATREALHQAGTRLLEPWSLVVVRVPSARVGDLISDISSHRGRVLGLEVEGATARLEASCPYRELRTFGSRLASLAAGRGEYEAKHSHYEPLPNHLVGEAIASSPFRRRTG